MVLPELSNNSRVPIAHLDQRPVYRYEGDLLTSIEKLAMWIARINPQVLRSLRLPL